MSRTTAEIQQVDAVRLTWVDTNNRTETIFKPLDHDVLCVTLKPSSPVLIYEHKFILYDSRLIFHRQLTLPYRLSVDWYTGHVSAGVLADISADSWSRVSRYVHRRRGGTQQRFIWGSSPPRSNPWAFLHTKMTDFPTLSYLSTGEIPTLFYRPEARENYPFWAEPPSRGHYRQ